MVLSSELDAVILILGSLSTSILSGIIGMGGGVLLLTLITFFFTTETIVPIHGIVQLVSNSSRALLLRKNIIWPVAKCFMLGLPLGLIAAVNLISNLSGEWSSYFICLIVFYTALKPAKLPQLKLSKFGFTILGFVVGGLGIMVGAVGPILAPFFVRDDFTKEQIVATKAVVQLLGHLIKIPAFLFLSFNYLAYLDIILAISIATILGTKLGVGVLSKISTKLFVRLYKTALLLAGIRFLYLSWFQAL